MNFKNYGSSPLYLEVKEEVIRRIKVEYWKPGDMLPSEAGLADELDVSPGTVRKALNELTAEQLLFRRQGKGTFVATHNSKRSLFHFFKLATSDGSREPAVSLTLSNVARKADKKEMEHLELSPNSKIIHISRLREMAGKVCILEEIVLPYKLFAKLEHKPAADLKNDLYPYYQEVYGVTVYQAHEKLRAIAATEKAAQLLNVETGSPLLEIVRIANNLEGVPVEIRKSLCVTDYCHYMSDLN